MNLKDWRFCSQEDDTISVHDCIMNRLEWDKGGLWLILEDGFNVAKGNSLNPTGRHRLTGKAAVFLKNGSYLEGDWNQNCTMQNSGGSKPIPCRRLPNSLQNFRRRYWTLPGSRRNGIFPFSRLTMLDIARSTSSVSRCGSAGMSCRRTHGFKSCQRSDTA